MPSISSASATRSAWKPSTMMLAEIKIAAAESAHHQPMPSPATPRKPGDAGLPIGLVHQRVGVQQFVAAARVASGSSLRPMMSGGIVA